MYAMITIRRAADRGHFNHGWLDTFHTFSFADYYDAAHMGFRVLRVINEDRVAPAQGFGTHPHDNMEILTYVLQGALQHKDSMGNGSVIRPGELQRMSAGTGVTHSEFNASEDEPVHLYQIWILPEREGFPPSYEQKEFPADGTDGPVRLVASRDGRDGSLTIHQDASVYLVHLEPGKKLALPFEQGRHAWVQIARGALTLNGRELKTSDGAALSGETAIEVATGDQVAEAILFDLP
jgi:redox-sensitive bicupin YhaK (pirin superfamily)